MAPEKREWTIPSPIRALLWWPGVAFVLVMVAPESAPLWIAVSGVVLVALGAALPPLVRQLRGARQPRRPTGDDRPTVEMPTVTIHRSGRAA